MAAQPWRRVRKLCPGVPCRAFAGGLGLEPEQRAILDSLGFALDFLVEIV